MTTMLYLMVFLLMLGGGWLNVVLGEHGLAQQDNVLQELRQQLGGIGEGLMDIAQVDRIGRANGSPC